MATANGTATDYLDLMAKFNTFVTGLGGGAAWTASRSSSTEYIWTAPGSGGSPADPLIIGAKAFFNVGADYYNWRLGGFMEFDSSLAFEAQAALQTCIQRKAAACQSNRRLQAFFQRQFAELERQVLEGRGFAWNSGSQ